MKSPVVFPSPELELFFPAAPAGSLTLVTVTQKTLGIKGEDLDLERQQLLDKVRQTHRLTGIDWKD